MTLLVLVTLILALAGLATGALTLIARSPYGAARLIRHGKDHSIPPDKFRRTLINNAVLALALTYGYTLAFQSRLFHTGPVSVTRCILEGAAILALFDFFYYLVHRYPFHEWRILRGVHAVHHVTRNPIALDCFYQHPLENFLGNTLLWACTWAVTLVAGPISAYSFAWLFLVHSLLNVVVHAGLDLKGPPWGIITYLATRHNKHHASMQGKNYASVTPLWDLLLGTEEP